MLHPGAEQAFIKLKGGGCSETTIVYSAALNFQVNVGRSLYRMT